jgi:hypothetical protein
MIQIELTHENADMLREMVASHLSELRMEIASTDRRDFRDYLRKRGEFLDQFLHQLDRDLAADVAPKESASNDRLRRMEILAH